MMLGVPHIDARRHSGTAPVGGDAVVKPTDKQQEEQEAQRTRQNCHRASLVMLRLFLCSIQLFCSVSLLGLKYGPCVRTSLMF